MHTRALHLFALIVAAAVAAPHPAAAGELESLRVEVVASHPHDPGAFTQGLVFRDGALFESTGLEGRSTLRLVDPATGVVAQQVALPPRYFGEGLALAGRELVQLTWRNGVARFHDAVSLRLLREVRYGGEGWGLTFDGKRLVMSDGSPTLWFRDPATFDILTSVTVRLAGTELRDLNELEWVDGSVYANVWRQDRIVRIDPATGRVTGDIDASGLLDAGERAKADVLNGIAYDPGRRVFYITGKLWPRLFEVRFVPR